MLMLFDASDSFALTFLMIFEVHNQIRLGMVVVAVGIASQIFKFSTSVIVIYLQLLNGAQG